MNSNLKMGRVLGISVGVHWSWFLVFALITWSLVGMFMVIETPQLGQTINIVLGVITSFLFFASILIHEFGHAVIALRNQIPVHSISLFVFGGVAHIGREPNTPGAEFRIAIAGPLASLLLASFFYVLSSLAGPATWLAAPSIWLARINLALAVFNMIPGFPLDGGRVFRAILWQVTGSHSRAHKAAVIGGQLVALCFIGYGVFSVFGGNFLSGIWMAFVGWFLNSAASNAPSPDLKNQSIENVSVEHVMERQFQQVNVHTRVTQLIEEKFIPHGYDLFYVTDGTDPKGLLSLPDVAPYSRSDFENLTVGEVMTPWERLVHIPVNTGLMTAIHTMDRANLAHAPVVEGKKMAVFLTREQIQRYMRIRNALKV